MCEKIFLFSYLSFTVNKQNVDIQCSLHFLSHEAFVKYFKSSIVYIYVNLLSVFLFPAFVGALRNILAGVCMA